jgi:hypothetical protein
MAVNLSPVGGVAAQFFDNSGNVLTGGKLYTYAAGTTTPQTTYTTSAGNIAWSNPIILDAAGRVSGSGEIWLTDGSQYKFILRDSNDVLIATYDNVIGINSNFVNFTNQQEIQIATAGQTVFNLTTTQYQPGTNSLTVFVDGVNQYGPGAQYAYVETDADTVTFTNGLHVGAEVKFTTSQLNSSSGQTAAQTAFTGFKGQIGTVQDLAGNDGSDWIGFEAAGANVVARSAQEKLRDWVSVKDFGAVGDGIADDTFAIQQAIATANSVLFPVGTYRITQTIEIGTQKALIGEYPQSRWVLGGKSTIYGLEADVGNGNPLFQAAATGSTQALTFENLSFQSDKTINPSDLSLMTNAGVVGVNVRGVKQGTQFLNCAFHNLKSAVRDDIGTGNYLDKVTFNQCHFNGLYLATKISPTAGSAFTNCYFDECYDWIDNTGEVILTATRFNNSSFSQESCQIKAARIIADGVYIEGGNNWFAPTQYVSVRGSYFSEAFSASGSTKFSVQPQNDGVYVNIEGTRIGTNTRVINTGSITDFKQFYVRFIGLSNGSSFGITASIESALEAGMVFEGWGNTQTAWNVKTTGVGTLNGRLRTAGDGVTARVGNLARGVYWQDSINFSLNCTENLEDYTLNNQYIRLVNVGTNNGTGGNIAYYVEIRIYKGFGTTWDYDITGPDAASYAVALSNPTSTTVDVALTESHTGNGEVLFMDSASSNMQITF